LIIQSVPKRSVSMPNFKAQKVSLSGMVTVARLASPSKMRSASAGSPTLSVLAPIRGGLFPGWASLERHHGDDLAAENLGISPESFLAIAVE
jgi:hypothetical protein